jgi:uncharacterized protein YjiS (DUF1127 family)
VPRVTHAIGMAWRRYLRHRRYLHELGELSAMDDLSLRDVGISRLEIRAAIRFGTGLWR